MSSNVYPRRQYYRDRDALAADGVPAAAFAVVLNPASRVRLVRRAYDG